MQALLKHVCVDDQASEIPERGGLPMEDKLARENPELRMGRTTRFLVAI
jgi:hypothetical protein